MVSLPQGFSIWNDTLDDVKTISGHRRPMFADMGYTDEAKIDLMAARFGPWLAGKMRAQEYLAWLAVTGEGEVAAGVGRDLLKSYERGLYEHCAFHAGDPHWGGMIAEHKP